MNGESESAHHQLVAPEGLRNQKTSPQRSRQRPQRQVVLVPLDGSEAAVSTLEAARIMSTQLSMVLHVLHVAAVPGPMLRMEGIDSLHLGTQLTPEDEIEVRAGDPASEIVRAINEPRTYLTVLATHGRIVEPGRHMGRVTEAVVASTTRPLLLIRPESAAAATSLLSARRFLLPLDGSPGTVRALRAVTDLVVRMTGSFDVLFVVNASTHIQAPVDEPGSLNVPYYLDQPQHEWPSWMREVLEHLSACCLRSPFDIPIGVHVRHGLVEESVLRFVEDHQNDAIVLVRRSHLEPGRATVLRAVLDRTPCPVLLVGAANHSSTSPRTGHNGVGGAVDV